ncbi:MAG: N-acetyltransferase [Alphaproteobacteria bacterium]|nr:N-acetyltransferase [Alphaproteobacteria bacterium]
MSLPAALPPISSFVLSPERAEDAPAIEALLDRAFGADRRSKRSYSYRQGCASLPELRLTARDGDGRLVGTIRYWPLVVRQGRRRRPALLLGPLAVEPSLAGRGIGRALVRESLDRARAAGHALVLLVGDVAYYGQFGFEPAAPRGFVMPGESPARLQALALAPGALAGGGTLEAVLGVRKPPMPGAGRSRTRAPATSAAAGL